jgi:hypothetical protein
MARRCTPAPEQIGQGSAGVAVHLQDVHNRYQPARTADGRPVKMFDEQLYRVQSNGDPDFTDPDVFPTIWPVH